MNMSEKNYSLQVLIVLSQVVLLKDFLVGESTKTFFFY